MIKHTSSNIAESIADILDFRTKFESPYDKKIMQEHNSHFIYRGQSNKEWGLIPSLKRATKSSEAKIIKNYMENTAEKQSIFEYISYLQHHGKPTRFLDYSTNILIALYFACKQEPKKDGQIFLSSYSAYKPSWLDTKIISSLALLEEPTTLLEFAEMLKEKYPSPEFKNIPDIINRLRSYIDHGILVVPTEDDYKRMGKINKRVEKQEGVFFICGNKITDSQKKPIGRRDISPGLSLESLIILPEIAEVPNTMTESECIIIPAQSKEEILRYLKLQNIDEEHLM